MRAILKLQNASPFQVLALAKQQRDRIKSNRSYAFLLQLSTRGAPSHFFLRMRDNLVHGFK